MVAAFLGLLPGDLEVHQEVFLSQSLIGLDVVGPMEPDALTSCFTSSTLQIVLGSFLTNSLTRLAKTNVRSSRSYRFSGTASSIAISRISNFEFASDFDIRISD